MLEWNLLNGRKFCGSPGLMTYVPENFINTKFWKISHKDDCSRKKSRARYHQSRTLMYSNTSLKIADTAPHPSSLTNQPESCWTLPFFCGYPSNISKRCHHILSWVSRAPFCCLAGKLEVTQRESPLSVQFNRKLKPKEIPSAAQ